MIAAPDLMQNRRTRHYACEDCGIDDTRVLIIHHIVPIGNGGTNTNDNLRMLCLNCCAIAKRLSA